MPRTQRRRLPGGMPDISPATKRRLFERMDAEAERDRLYGLCVQALQAYMNETDEELRALALQAQQRYSAMANAVEIPPYL